jgi:hypothetical protein
MDAYLNSALEKSGGEEKDKNTCALARLASPRWASRGMAWQWARARDVRRNGLSKSGPKPHRYTASFCYFFAISLCLIRFDRET